MKKLIYLTALFALSALMVLNCENSISEQSVFGSTPQEKKLAKANIGVSEAVDLPDSTPWRVLGNEINPTEHFLGSLNAADLLFKTSNAERLRITSNGNVGIGMSTPTSPLTMALGDKIFEIRSDDNLVPGINLSGTGGNLGIMRVRNKIEMWPNDAATVAGSFDVRDITGATRISLDGGSGNAYFLGTVGVGTTNPRDILHLFKGTPSTVGVLMGNSFTGSGRRGLLVDYHFTNGAEFWNFENTDMWFGTNNTRRMTIKNNGNVGIGTTNPQGKLDVNGSIYQRGGLLHADYVFEPDYELEPIEEHADFMWDNKHLKAIPKAKVDAEGREIVEVGSHRRGIVEELEKAHIYIEQLHQRMKTLEEKLASLE